MSTHPLDPDETDFAGVAVYNGMRKLGEIRERGKQAEARLADGTVIGTYDNRKAATAALHAALGPARLGRRSL